jgi:hypothetical protein
MNRGAVSTIITICLFSVLGCLGDKDIQGFIGEGSLSCLPSTSHTAFGTGTQADPYLICNAAQLESLGLSSGDWGMHYKLDADIDLSAYTGNDFPRLGNGAPTFTGTFDGANHTISNFTFSDTSDQVGLFGQVTGDGVIDGVADGEIKNLHLTGVNVTGDDSVGALVGQLTGGRIENCSATGTLTASSYGGGLIGQALTSSVITQSNANVAVTGLGAYVGGLIGATSTSSVTDSYALGNVISQGWGSGGLVGYSVMDTIERSYARGNVSDAGTIIMGRTGGLLGWGLFTTIRHSYATGSVSSANGGGVGGLLGYANSATIVRSYAVGAVSGVSDFGGLIGFALVAPTFTGNSYWNATVNAFGADGGIGSSVDPITVVGETTANMKLSGTYSGWNFTSPGGDWDFSAGVNSDYPVHQ